jgi:hypothetical protein
MSEENDNKIVEKTHGKIPMVEDMAVVGVAAGTIDEAVANFKKLSKDEQIEVLMETVLVQASENQVLRANMQELNRNMQNLEREIKKSNEISAPRKVGAVNRGFMNEEEKAAEDAGKEDNRKGVMRFH